MTGQPPQLATLRQELLRRLRTGDTGPAAAAITRGADSGPFRMSFPQERVLLTHLLAEDVALFNLAAALPLKESLAPTALRGRLAALAARHDSLRTSVRIVDGEPMLHVADSLTIDLPEHRVSGDADSDEALRRVHEIGRRPYRIDEAPLWRAELVAPRHGPPLLVLGAHHLIADATSFGIMIKELLEDGDLPPLPVRYSDFAAWQRERVTGGAFDDQLGYWRERLLELPPPLRLPASRPRPATPTYRGESLHVDLPPDIGARLTSTAREIGATPFSVLLAAYYILLNRYAEADDLVVGVTVSGRSQPELQHVVGMFVNMVPLRISMTGDPSFRQFVGRVGAGLYTAMDHADIPFEQIVNDLRPQWSGTHPGLVQVSFNMPIGDEQSASSPTEVRLPVAMEGSHLDLTMHMLPAPGDSYWLVVEYSSDLFTKATAGRLADQFVSLMRRVLTAPDEPIRAAAATHDRRTPVLWGAVAGSGGGLLPDAVGDRVARSPDAVAVVGVDGVSVSYVELDRRANRLAHYLRGLGVGAEVAVGVCLPRGVDMVVALLAVWRAGGAYVPLDPGQVTDRSRFVLGDAGARVVVTDACRGALLGGQGRVLVMVDEVGSALAELPVSAPVGGVSGPGAAYVLYTSGSSGAPKGVVVTHEGIANYVRWVVRDHRLGPDDRVLQKTPLVFDAAGWEIFGPLVSGGTVVLAPSGVERDPDEIVRLVGARGITVLQVVPSLLQMLVDAPGWSDCGRLRMIFSAGEPLHAELCVRVRALTSAEIRNTYGPTECAIDSTGAVYDPAQVVGPVPIGVPVDNAYVVVLDGAGDPVMEGAPGELYVGGPGIARGYIGRPELTAQRFVPDRFGQAGSRLYRTGDLVRLRSDGLLEYLGRIDDQVKINGVRVEPGEIEAVLTGHPEISAAAVMAVAAANATGGQCLGAYLQVAVSLDVAQLRIFLRERLPDYLVPAVFVCLPVFPLTASGKIDRRALPALGAVGQQGSFVAPRGHGEQQVAAVWAGLLGVDRVGATDDFFALGGHSLLLTRLAARLRERFDTDVALRDLMVATTVTDQARLVRQYRRSEPIEVVSRAGVLPLSSGQRRLWFLDQLEPGSAQYVLPYVVRLRGEVDIAALRASVSGLVRRHEVLRTRYPVVDGEPVQVIDPAGEVPITVLPASAASMAALVGGELARPFDLADSPLLRATLLPIARDDAVLLIVVHHIACDGWSLPILDRELRAGYAAAVGGGSPPSAPVIQYADFAAWQQARLDESQAADQLAFWRDRLTGAAPTELPSDRPRPAVRSGRGAVAGFVVPAELTGRALRLGRAEGATAFMTMLAAFKALLLRYTGQEDLTIGTPVAGRTHASTEDLIGFFVNTLALRTDMSGEPSFKELLRRVRTDCLQAYAHQDLPFEHIVEAIHPDRDSSRNPLFQIMFDMTAEPHPADSTGLTIEPYTGDVPWHTAKFDLTLTLTEQPDGSLHGLVEYATDLFDTATINQLTTHYLHLLTTATDAPDTPITHLSLIPVTLPEPAIDRGPAVEHAGTDGVPSAIVRRAMVNPDAVAVAQEDVVLTYAGLVAWADALAAELRRRGIATESPVVLQVRRSLELVVAWLATLRAGGVCVPVDPDQPAERISQLIAEAGAELLLTRADVAAVRAEMGIGPGLSAGGGSTAPDPDPDQLAYMIYTSGSTGRPKGVMIPHRAYLHHCWVMIAEYGIHPGDRVALLSSPVFDVAMDQIATALLAGATVVVADSDLASPDRLCDWLHDQEVTHLQITPAHYRQVMDALDAGDERLSRLRVMDVGADIVRYADAKRWYAAGLPARFLCSYGPTECTVTTTVHPVGRDEADRCRPERVVPIGRPVAGTTGHVLDRWLNPVPPGVAGELYVAGQRLARGYRDRPGRTAGQFVPNPFGGGPGERLYRTGDLVRYRRDGALEFLGRIDNQVKIRGFRVEPGEAEAVLAGHPSVHAAAVTVYRGGGGEPELAAYVVPRSGTDLLELRAYLTDRLPAYLVPAYWTVLDALPMTASEKVDRRALPEPTRLRRGYQAPDSVTERRIAAIWADLLRLDKVGVDEDFFELGGHSLLATRIRSRLRDELGVELPLRRLFAATTVAALAVAVEDEVSMAVADLSDEEVEAMMAQSDGGAG